MKIANADKVSLTETRFVCNKTVVNTQFSPSFIPYNLGDKIEWQENEEFKLLFGIVDVKWEFSTEKTIRVIYLQQLTKGELSQ